MTDMNIRKRVFALALAAIVGAGIASVPVSPALADGKSPATPPTSVSVEAQIMAPPASCTWDSICGYVDNSFQTGEGYELIPISAPYPTSCKVLAHRNAWTSVYNNTSRTIRLYLNTSCTGTLDVQYKTMAPGTGISYLWASWSPSWNDTLDAARAV